MGHLACRAGRNQVVPALELIQPGRVHLVADDAAQEEVIAEQSAGPAQFGAAGGIGDRVQGGGRNGEPGFFAQFACRGVSEFLAFFDATAGHEPSVAGPDQQQPVRSINQQDTGRPAGELRHNAKGKAPYGLASWSRPAETQAAAVYQLSRVGRCPSCSACAPTTPRRSWPSSWRTVPTLPPLSPTVAMSSTTSSPSGTPPCWPSRTLAAACSTCSSARMARYSAGSTCTTLRTARPSSDTGSRSTSRAAAWRPRPCKNCAGSRPRGTGCARSEQRPLMTTSHPRRCWPRPGSFRLARPSPAAGQAPGISVTWLPTDLDQPLAPSILPARTRAPAPPLINSPIGVTRSLKPGCTPDWPRGGARRSSSPAAPGRGQSCSHTPSVVRGCPDSSRTARKPAGQPGGGSHEKGPSGRCSRGRAARPCGRGVIRRRLAGVRAGPSQVADARLSRGVQPVRARPGEQRPQPAVPVRAG